MNYSSVSRYRCVTRHAARTRRHARYARRRRQLRADRLLTWSELETCGSSQRRVKSQASVLARDPRYRVARAPGQPPAGSNHFRRYSTPRARQSQPPAAVSAVAPRRDEGGTRDTGCSALPAARIRHSRLRPDIAARSRPDSAVWRDRPARRQGRRRASLRLLFRNDRVPQRWGHS
jgi:hypothetical protein